MASTYSTNLAIELIGTGEQAGTWGVTTNTNLGTLIEQAISGYVTQAVATGTDTTITIPNGATGVARNMYIELTGTGGTNTNLIVPANKKLYFIFNNSTGAVTVKVAAQTGVSVAAGEKKILVSNGTDIVEATSYISANATSASIVNLNVTSANITTLTSASGTITNLLATDASFGSASLSNADILSAVIGSATITGAGITSAAITTVTGTTLGYGSASLSNLKAVSAVITSATVTGLGVTSAAITTLTGTTVSYASGSLTNLNVSASATLARFSAGSSAVSNLLASGAITAVGNISTSGNLSASGSITASSGSITQLTSTSATITTLKATSATLDNVSFTSIVLTNATVTSANITTLTGTTVSYASASITTVTGVTIGAALSSTILGISGSITNLSSTSANITTLTGTTASYGSASLTGLNAASANITTLTGTTFGTTATTQLRGASGAITTLTGTSADIATITGLTIGNTTSSTIRGISGAITTLTGTSADITTITGLTIGNTTSSTIRGISGNIGQFAATSATITTLSGSTLGYGSASLANLGAVSAVITSATVTNLGSTSAAITTLSNTTLNSGSASITVLTGGNVTFTSGTITNLVTTSITLSTVNFTSATIVNLNSTSAVIATLNGTSADITTITGTTIGTTASATIRGASGVIGQFNATSATITTITGTSSTITTIASTSATITTLTGTTVGYGSASLTNMKAVSAVITSATITGLGVTSAAITTLTGTTLGYASASITTVTGTTIGAALSSTILGLSGSITNFNTTSAAIAKFTAGSSAVSNFLASGTITALGNISTSGNLSASGSITALSGSITNLSVTSAVITSASVTGLGVTSANITTLTGTTLGYASASVTNINIATSATIGRFNAGSSAVGNLFASGTIQTSGNIGVGTAVSAWTTPFSVMQLGATYGAYIAGQSNGADLKIGTNNYYNGTNYVYTVSNAPASRFDVGQSGAPGFAWNVAASGTVGGTITFTQAMTLDSSGNLGVGETSPDTRVHIYGANTAGRGQLYIQSNGTISRFVMANSSDAYSLNTYGDSATSLLTWDTSSGYGYRWTVADSEKMRLDSSGNLLVGTTSASAWSTAGRGLVEVNGSSTALIGLKTGGTQRGYVYSQGTDLIVQAVTGVLSLNGTGGSGASVDSSGNLGIGTSSPASRLDVAGAFGTSTTAATITNTTSFSASNIARIDFRLNNSFAGLERCAAIWALNPNATANNGGALVFGTSADGTATTPSERARITSDGTLLVGKTTDADAGSGVRLTASGLVQATRDQADPLSVNRTTNDGVLVSLRQDGTEEGTISVSGNTVSYNAFAGSHWSQLQDGSKPDILRGTVMESINELCVWPGEQNERLPKSKISDTAGSKKVYGVFMAWDNDWTTTNDMYVTAVGAFICRVNGSVTVQEGDLLESNGDGTARVQVDDIIRSSTIGKVTSTVKTHEYDDGSYCVPTVLYCG